MKIIASTTTPDTTNSGLRRSSPHASLARLVCFSSSDRAATPDPLARRVSRSRRARRPRVTGFVELPGSGLVRRADQS